MKWSRQRGGGSYLLDLILARSPLVLRRCRYKKGATVTFSSSTRTLTLSTTTTCVFLSLVYLFSSRSLSSLLSLPFQQQLQQQQLPPPSPSSAETSTRLAQLLAERLQNRQSVPVRRENPSLIIRRATTFYVCVLRAQTRLHPS